MAMSGTEKNALAVKFGTDSAFASLHSSDPGTTGANEISGGSPAYARKAVTWGAASNGQVTVTATFDVASGVTVGGGGLWSAASGGNFLNGGTVSPQTFSQQGTYQLTYTFSVAG
jgi:hypothetical protein